MKRIFLLCAILFLASAALSAGDECYRPPTGMVPLPELGVASYKGMQGGLYPGGSNARPAAHNAAGLAMAAQVVPRDANGVPDAAGKVVLLSIGMSNTTQEFTAFIGLVKADPERNPHLMVVDGAQGGQTAAIISNPQATFWTNVDIRIAQANATAAQVQAVWLKEADAQPTKPFPDHAQLLQAELKAIVQILHSRFPNLKLVYFSSRTYGGYALSKLNPEPYAYEGAFAVKWLIEQQINGDPDLSYDAVNAKAPWLAWGPYLWADGTRLRAADGFSYACDDFRTDDRTHPSSAGQLKVARLLMDFLKTDATSRPWFVKPPAEPPPVPKAAALVNSASFDSALAPRSIGALFGSELAPSVGQAIALPLPTSLNGVTVEIGGVPCPLLYVSPSQINLVIPANTGNGELRVRRENSSSGPLSLAISGLAPAVFTLPSGATILPAAAIHSDDGTVISDAAPAAPGESIAIYLTGLGAIDYVAWQTATRPAATIGGQDAPVSWVGPAPGFPGLDQLNLFVPSGVPSGRQTLQVLSGSKASAAVSLSIK